MKALFAQRSREARAAAGEPPRALVRAGHVHLTRGLGALNEVYALGNFLSELAAYQGGTSLRLYALVKSRGMRNSFVAPPIRLMDGHADPSADAVIDLRPLHPWAALGLMPDLDPELRRLIMGSDALVILRDARRGSVDALRTSNFRAYPG